jgi:ACT domain-containing protein
MNQEEGDYKMSKNTDKAIVTVVGKDTVGIIAKTCTYLADHKINILDISQTIVQGYFNMMMIADFANADQEFDKIQEELAQVGTDLGVDIKCQKAEIFEMMHRI